MRQSLFIDRPAKWVGAAPNRIAEGFLRPLAGNRDLVFYFTSEGVWSMAGSAMQVALPYLAVQLTGSAAAMGVVILLSGVSRIGLMMVGGFLVDRFSPRPFILGAGLLRAGLLACLTGLALLGITDISWLYMISFGMGIADAFALPARASMLPRLVPLAQIRTANAWAAGQEKAAGVAGPVIAGLMISVSSLIYNAKASLGVGLVFFLSFFSALLSLYLINHVPISKVLRAASVADRSANRLEPVHQLLEIFRREKMLAGLCAAIYGVNALSAGPLAIGLPVMVVSRFSGGKNALGWLSACIAGGALLGSILAGILPGLFKTGSKISFFLPVSVLIVSVGWVLTATSLGDVFMATFLATASIGYLNVVGMSSIQRLTPPAYLGRVMGLLNLK